MRIETTSPAFHLISLSPLRAMALETKLPSKLSADVTNWNRRYIDQHQYTNHQEFHICACISLREGRTFKSMFIKNNDPARASVCCFYGGRLLFPLTIRHTHAHAFIYPSLNALSILLDDLAPAEVHCTQPLQKTSQLICVC